MPCKECRGSLYSVRVDDVWKLYNPGLRVGMGGPWTSRCKPTHMSCGKSVGKCKMVNNLEPNCVDKMKGYWSKNCETPLLRRYEDQPWFRDRIVQSEWKNFVDQLVTPANIGCRLCPGPDDWQFKCHRARSLIGPVVPCVWELPEQDECATTQYGYNRDWRRYNDDQRMLASDMACGCNDRPVCCPKKKSEWPPYLGKKYGPRYMAWAHPSKMMFPRTRVFNYQSLPKC